MLRARGCRASKSSKEKSMRGSRLQAATLVLGAAFAAAPAALAAGGGGSGSGGGGGGGSTPCTPLVTTASVGHTDFSGNWHIGVQATIRNCTAANQLYHINVSVPGSSELPFNADLGLPPNGSVTRFVSPGGGTPLQLQFGQTYTVVATLTRTTTSPAQVLSTVDSTVAIPAAPGG
jgi:hypothetical protein